MIDPGIELERKLVELIGHEVAKLGEGATGREAAMMVISALSGALVRAWLATMANENVPVARRIKAVVDGIRDAPWEEVVKFTLYESGELSDEAQANN